MATPFTPTPTPSKGRLKQASFRVEPWVLELWNAVATADSRSMVDQFRVVAMMEYRDMFGEEKFRQFFQERDLPVPTWTDR